MKDRVLAFDCVEMIGQVTKPSQNSHEIYCNIGKSCLLVIGPQHCMLNRIEVQYVQSSTRTSFNRFSIKDLLDRILGALEDFL